VNGWTLTRRRGAAVGLALLLEASILVAAPSVSAGSQGWSRGIESWVTDLAGDQRLAAQPTIDWQRGSRRSRATIVVDPARRYQTMTGFGASMTDSSAYVLSKLPADAREKVMRSLFSPTDGIGLSMLRQPMGASDFAVDKAYSYDDQPEALWLRPRSRPEHLSELSRGPQTCPPPERSPR